VIVDSWRFLPRSFRPFYEGRGPFPDEGQPVWAPFVRRLAEVRIGLLTSAGIYMKGRQRPFDMDREREHPTWGDPTWRAIAADVSRDDIAVAHLHINDDDLLADPEIALPAHGLQDLVEAGVAGGAVEEHVAVMGYQDRSLRDWRETTAPAIVAHLQAQQADGLVLAPA